MDSSLWCSCPLMIDVNSLSSVQETILEICSDRLNQYDPRVLPERLSNISIFSNIAKLFRCDIETYPHLMNKTSPIFTK